MGLTDTEVRKARPSDKAYRLSDSGGLYLFVSPSGGKLWRWKYRFTGEEKLMAFGNYPAVSLAEARELHAGARKLLASGVDPMAKRKADKIARKTAAANSFQSVAALWLDHWRPAQSPRHAAYVERRLKADVLPAIGPRPIEEVEALELVALIKAIQDRGARDIAKRALQTAGQVFRFAIAHGYAKRNPAADIKPSDILKPGRVVNLARVDAKELPGLLKAIEVYRGQHATRFALKLMALVFVRTSELIGARWSEFDFEAARWNIPAERMKMRTPHIVPLARQTIEVLETLHLVTGGGEFLFPGERDLRKSISNNTLLFALARMGYKGRMTGHGFRGLASTLLHEQGYDHAHIELQLAHAPRNAVSAAYNHALYLEPRAKMMQCWADFLERVLHEGRISTVRPL